jgi:hypothetical protein
MSFAYVLASLLTFAVPSQPASPNPAIQEKDSISRVVDRLPLKSARHYIVNRRNTAALLLLDTTIVLQMTDQGLKDLGREMKSNSNEKPSGMPKLLEKMLLGSIKALLDHGIEYSLSDLKEARVEDGVLVLESKTSDDPVFSGVKINDDRVLETFSEADARRFAKLVNRAKHQH